MRKQRHSVFVYVFQKTRGPEGKAKDSVSRQNTDAEVELHYYMAFAGILAKAKKRQT